MDLPICTACGTRFPQKDISHCKICDDPRQFVPPEGQKWTTLAEVQRNHKNKWKQLPYAGGRIWSIWTEPKFAIGQRCLLVQTDHGNFLWDLIALLDDETIEFINSKGGLKAIVISHPHYYTTHAYWASVFKCQIHVPPDDKMWFSEPAPPEYPIKDVCVTTHPDDPSVEEILPGAVAIKTGGHFDGSMVLIWEKILMHGDTFIMVPSGLSPPAYERASQITYAFMWSIPNSIPMAPVDIRRIISKLDPYEFEVGLGAFAFMEREETEKGRLKKNLEMSADIQIAHQTGQTNKGRTSIYQIKKSLLEEGESSTAVAQNDGV